MPALCFYGDDFTGSTDVLDALFSAGVSSALILEPSSEAIAMLPEVEAIGLAGMSRVMSPEEMEQELPVAFNFLASLGPRILHYKVCSTFDSSPSKGNIGKAMEIGRRLFGCGPTPIAVGAPALGRYVAFGNLFARAGANSEIYRLDRHPIMSHHPVTPMMEADLRRHLAAQTSLPVDLVPLSDIEAGEMPRMDISDRAVLFDTTTPAHLSTIGRWLQDCSRAQPIFSVGSSAVEAAYYSQSGGVSRTAPQPKRIAAGARPIAVVSGSCSTTTARQIDFAAESDFTPICVAVARLVDGKSREAVCEEAVGNALAELERGRSPIVFTAHGSADPFYTRAPASLTPLERRIGEGLGTILRNLVKLAGLKKVVVAGGDTSGLVAKALDLVALQVAAPLDPGAPLCLGTCRDGAGIEIALKGGQMGRDDFFVRARDS